MSIPLGIVYMIAQLIGAMLAGHLSGELDIASTGIGLVDQLSVGLNLDVAAEQGIEFTPELMERAHVLLQDGGMSGRNRAGYSLAKRRGCAQSGA
jgi:hypothetical protein